MMPRVRNYPVAVEPEGAMPVAAIGAAPAGARKLAACSRVDPRVNTEGPPTMAVSLPIGIWIMVSICAHTSFVGLEPLCAG